MDDTLYYRMAADGLLLLHVAFMLFVVVGLALIIFGGFRHWEWVRNPWFRSAHLAAIAVVVAQAWLGRVCPLTVWEMALRVRGGDAAYRGAFVAHWLEELLYYEAPHWAFALAYTLFAGLVVTTWWQVRPRTFSGRYRDPDSGPGYGKSAGL